MHFKVLPDTALHNVTTRGIIGYKPPPGEWKRDGPKIKEFLLVGGYSWGKKEVEFKGNGREEIQFSKDGRGGVKTFVGKKKHVHNLIDLFLHVP